MHKLADTDNKQQQTNVSLDLVFSVHYETVIVIHKQRTNEAIMIND